jgi:UDP-3-O-[3-hydroxymyristoyl] glucosamine N-acyltransferase
MPKTGNGAGAIIDNLAQIGHNVKIIGTNVGCLGCVVLVAI